MVSVPQGTVIRIKEEETAAMALKEAHVPRPDKKLGAQSEIPLCYLRLIFPLTLIYAHA